jgi:hypothetical protein
VRSRRRRAGSSAGSWRLFGGVIHVEYPATRVGLTCRRHVGYTACSHTAAIDQLIATVEGLLADPETGWQPADSVLDRWSDQA